MYLLTKWFGTFLCDNKGTKKQVFFPKDEKEIAKRLIKVKNGEILLEEKKLSKNIKVIVSEKRLKKIGTYDSSNVFFDKIKIDSEEFGYSNFLLQKASIIASKSQVEEKLESEDLQIIQMINTLDDLIHTSNLLYERLDRWNEIKASKKRIRPLENVYSSVLKEIKSLEKQIESDMNIIAPNTSNLAGPIIGARLISLSGGLDHLAFLPASTIQILGAEKALFRHKKEGSKPPKHGVIFQHSYINKAPRDARGKIARAFATKISTAVKADTFTKRNISGELIKDLQKRMREINKSVKL
jgi:nucleolar protein 56